MTEMNRLFTYMALFISTLFLSCSSKSNQEESAVYNELSAVEQMVADTLNVPTKEEKSKKEDILSTPVCSSSFHPHNSISYDNMRGFDPASENDMDDNGMSRYMENYDDDGWN